MIMKEVSILFDGARVWVNSAERCEVRICGLEKVKGLVIEPLHGVIRPMKGKMSISDGCVDITVVEEE